MSRVYVHVIIDVHWKRRKLRTYVWNDINLYALVILLWHCIISVQLKHRNNNAVPNRYRPNHRHIIFFIFYSTFFFMLTNVWKPNDSRQWTPAGRLRMRVYVECNRKKQDRNSSSCRMAVLIVVPQCYERCQRTANNKCPADFILTINARHGVIESNNRIPLRPIIWIGRVGGCPVKGWAHT